MSRFKLIILTTVCFLIFEFMIGVIYIVTPTEVGRYDSPDGNYTLVVKKEFRLFTMPGDGGLASSPAVIILQDKWGFEIGEPITMDHQCGGTFLGDVSVKWDMNDNVVYYSKARGINLKTGDAGC